MKTEFIPYEQALALKELGFDEPLLGRFYTKPKCKMFGIDEKGRHYPIKNTPKKLYILGEHFVLNDDNVTIAPLYQQVFRWFREKYQLQYTITWNKFYEKTPQQWEVRKNWIDEPSIPYGYGGMCSTYEEAELACLNKLIEIVKNK